MIIKPKSNSSGSLTWNRTVTTSGAEQDIGYALAIDDSENVYITGHSI